MALSLDHAQAPILLDIDQRGVATVTFNRPHVNNAYNGELIDALLATVTRLSTDRDVRVVVLRGNGRHFQAGADLKWLESIAQHSTHENLAISRATANAVRGLSELDKPTLALVHGGCFGGGTGIVAACDIVIAADDAIFSITEARWGVIAGIIFPLLIATIGLANVRRYALTCERFEAHRAREIGLVQEVVAREQLEQTADTLIEHLLHSAPDAIAQSKALCLELAGLAMDNDTYERLIAQHSAKRQSAEAIEGLASFLEKRKPQWYRH